MKKGTKPKQVRPQASFAQMVAVEVQRQVNGAIAEQVKMLEGKLQQMVFNISKFNALRMKSLEDYVSQKDSLSAEFFDEQALLTEDKIDGYETSQEGIVVGDRVRFLVKDVNSKNDAEQLKLDNFGAEPYQLNETIEKEMVGLKTGEKKEIVVSFGEDKTFTYEVEVKLVSKQTPAKDEEKN